MREFECHEREPLPRQESVDIVALRPHDDATAQELRRSLPEVLAGIVGEVAGARLGLTLLTDADGMVEISVTAAAGYDTPAVLAELAGALEPIAETAVSTEPKSPALSRSAVVPDRPRRELGFAHQTRPGAVASMRWQSRDALSTQLIEDLASLPGQGLEVALRPRPQVGQTRWEAQIHVVTAGDDPSRPPLPNRGCSSMSGSERGCHPEQMTTGDRCHYRNPKGRNDNYVRRHHTG